MAPIPIQIQDRQTVGPGLDFSLRVCAGQPGPRRRRLLCQRLHGPQAFGQQHGREQGGAGQITSVDRVGLEAIDPPITAAAIT